MKDVVMIQNNMVFSHLNIDMSDVILETGGWMSFQIPKLQLTSFK